jgi:tricarballylate dehydrogenase
MTGGGDVVVVGCGVAGLAAAVSARAAGARVVVLERSSREERGGNSRYTESYFRMKSEREVSDDFQSGLESNAGGYLDPDLVKGVLKSQDQWPPLLRSLSFVDPELIGEFARQVPGAVAWLRGFGVRFEFLPTQFITQATPRLLPVGGGLALVEALGEAAERQGVVFHYETAAQSLLMADDGGVIGVRARARGGTSVEFRGPVILGCGGFEGNPEMLTQYLGAGANFLRPVARGGLYNKGEGIRMALAAGAAPAGEFGGFHAEPIDPRSGASEPSIMIFPYGILVNRRGERFVDEASDLVDRIYEEVTRAIWRQPQGIAYCVCDARVREIPGYMRAIRSDQPAIEADSLRTLAARLELPGEAFEATVGRYNAAASREPWNPMALDGRSTRGLLPPKSNWALPLERAPFFAYPMICSVVFTYGGVKVTPRSEVINTDGDAIRGLYAAGEVIGMYYGSYLGSTSVLKALVFGRIAGAEAAGATRRA